MSSLVLRRCRPLATLLAALAIGAAAVGGVAFLQLRSEGAHETQRTLDQAERLIATMQPLPWNAAVPANHSDVSAKLRATALSLRGQLSKLPDNAQRSSLLAFESILDGSLETLLAQVRSGQVDKAEIFNRRAVDPEFAHFSTLVADVSDGYEQRAETAQWLTVAGSAALVALALAVLGILVVRTRRSLQRAERAEAGLEHSDEQYRQLFDLNPDPMWVYERETLRFLAVNQAAVKRYGFTRAEFAKMLVSELRQPSVPLGGPTPVGQTVLRTHRTRDGVDFEVEASARDVVFEGRPGRLVLARDVTAERQAAIALHDSESRYRDLFENATAPIATLGLDDRITEVNEAFAQLLGSTPDEMVGTHLNSYLAPSEIGVAERQLDLKLRGQETQTRYEQQFISLDGRRIILEVETRLLYQEGKPVGTQGICHDITAQREAELESRQLAEQNHQLATRDALTGLPNRASFQSAISEKTSDGGESAVLVLDLDHFKHVNDTLGHDAGDRLLEKIAGSLRGALGEGDVLARLGGDEFGVLVGSAGRPLREACEATLKRLAETLRQPFLVDSIPLTAEASIGIACYPADGSTAELLLQNADIALYQAKQDAPSHSFYRPDRNRHDAARLRLLGELRRAIDENELELHYQPKLDLHTGDVQRVEALVRWRHPERGLLMPSEFIEAAEQTSLIGPLTLHVVERAIEQVQSWSEKGIDLDVAVNLSARNLGDHDLPDKIAAILDRNPGGRDRLLLEVTESALFSDPVRAGDLLNRLADLGVQLAIDDFGSGYTSLASLAKLPIHQLKIDRTFITGLENSRSNQAIVRAISNLAHDLGLVVVAEGIDSAETEAWVKRLDCDVGQGFHYAPALTSAKLETWFRGRRVAAAA